MLISQHAVELRNGTGRFTFGLSDRGDQFFLRATTDSSGAQSFVYGTAVRNFDGSITYTSAGSFGGTKIVLRPGDGTGEAA